MLPLLDTGGSLGGTVLVVALRRHSWSTTYPLVFTLAWVGDWAGGQLSCHHLERGWADVIEYGIVMVEVPFNCRLCRSVRRRTWVMRDMQGDVLREAPRVRLLACVVD